MQRIKVNQNKNSIYNKYKTIGKVLSFQIYCPCQDCLVVSVYASDLVGCGFVPQPGHIINHHKNGKNCLPACNWHAGVREGIWHSTTDYVKSRVVCGTVYGDMHYKDLLGSITRVR